MPNVKIYVEHALLERRETALAASLEPLRALLCARLAVPAPACQLAVLGVCGLPDQPAANLEMLILPRPERTREMITALGQEVQVLIGAALETPVAFRAAMLDAQTYVALK